MMWPSSQASKVLSLLFAATIVYCIFMDTFLFFRIQYYSLDAYANITEFDNGTAEKDYESVTWIPCGINPLCHPTVKALMVDHVNHYIYGPLCAVVDTVLGISERMVILTPNLVSFSHVLVAIAGAKLLTCNALAYRRMGIVLFQLRMFLDDLDGHVARERRHVVGEHSEVGSLGYYVDGICDLLGVIAMMIGVFLYLRANPPRRGYKGLSLTSLPYHQLAEVSSVEDESDEVGIMYKTKVAFGRIVRVLLLFSGQMALSSIAWNRYIDIYQLLLERPGDLGLALKQERVFRSSAFFCTTGLWRVVNPHCYLHLLSLAVFCDKTWVCLTAVQYAGYLGLLLAVAVTEYLASNVHVYVAAR